RATYRLRLTAARRRSSSCPYVAARARSPRSRSCPCRSSIGSRRCTALAPTSPRRTRVSPATIARERISAPRSTTPSHAIACWTRSRRPRQPAGVKRPVRRDRAPADFPLATQQPLFRRSKMKTYLALAIAGLSLQAASAAQAQSPQQPPSYQFAAQQRAGIEEVLKSYERSLNASDVAGVVQLYTDDAVLLAPEAPSAVGIEAVRNAYTGIFQAI